MEQIDKGTPEFFGQTLHMSTNRVSSLVTYLVAGFRLVDGLVGRCEVNAANVSDAFGAFTYTMVSLTPSSSSLVMASSYSS